MRKGLQVCLKASWVAFSLPYDLSAFLSPLEAKNTEPLQDSQYTYKNMADIKEVYSSPTARDV